MLYIPQQLVPSLQAPKSSDLLWHNPERQYNSGKELKKTIKMHSQQDGPKWSSWEAGTPYSVEQTQSCLKSWRDRVTVAKNYSFFYSYFSTCSFAVKYDLAINTDNHLRIINIIVHAEIPIELFMHTRKYFTSASYRHSFTLIIEVQDVKHLDVLLSET